MKQIIFAMTLVLFSQSAFSEVSVLKQQIFELAESYKGQGDPDGSKQKSLEVLIEKLLSEKPQPPVTDRLKLLYGAWKQVWGPYDYRNSDRGVDPKIDSKNIYQVVFDGYYYNVNPTLKDNGEIEKITLLRGAFTKSTNDKNVLLARFTDLRSVSAIPTPDLRLIDLAALSESRTLAGEKTILPSFLVKLFFGGGTLEEVYTDEDMRIAFGSGKNKKVQKYIYVLKRENL